MDTSASWCENQGVDSEDLARRVRAARALAPPSAVEVSQRTSEKRKPEPGISRGELADRIAEPGLGEKVLGKIERGEKMPALRDLRAIADATGVPLEFFLLERNELLTLLEQDQVQTLERWRRRSGLQREGSESGSRSLGEA